MLTKPFLIYADMSKGKVYYVVFLINHDLINHCLLSKN